MKKRQTPCFNETERYVAGIDLAGNADHYVCGPRKDDGSHDIDHFGTTTRELKRMLKWLQDRHVVSVAMESTSVYWIPVYDLLETNGIKPLLVDTRTVRMVPGRKSDVKDCQWLQKLLSCGLLVGAFRPPERFNAIRMVIREKDNILQMRTQAIQMIQKSLDQMNIRLHHAVSDIAGETGMQILRAIVEGERDPVRLAGHRDPRCKKSIQEIAEHLTGSWREEHLFILEQAYMSLVSLTERLDAFNVKIAAMYASLASATGNDVPDSFDGRTNGSKRKGGITERRNLARIVNFDITKIDGIGIETAYGIVAEIGNDLSMFPDESHFVSWAGLAPPLGKSAGKNVRNKKFKNTNRVGVLLRQAAMSLLRSECELGARFRSIRSRATTPVAAKAVARRMAQYIYRGVKYGAAYVDEGEMMYEQRRRDRTIRSIRRTIAKLAITADELMRILPTEVSQQKN